MQETISIKEGKGTPLHHNKSYESTNYYHYNEEEDEEEEKKTENEDYQDKA